MAKMSRSVRVLLILMQIDNEFLNVSNKEEMWWRTHEALENFK